MTEDDGNFLISSSDENDFFMPKKVPFTNERTMERDDSSSANSSADSAVDPEESSSCNDASILQTVPKSATKVRTNPYKNNKRGSSAIHVSRTTSSNQPMPLNKSEIISRQSEYQSRIEDSAASSPAESQVVTQLAKKSIEGLIVQKSTHIDLRGNDDFPWSDHELTPRKESPEPSNAYVLTLGENSSRIDENDNQTKTRHAESEINVDHVPFHHGRQVLPISATESSPFRYGRVSEVDPHHYTPLPYQERSKPLVHYLSAQNRPLNTRKNLPIQQVFDFPVTLLWKDKFNTFNHLQSEVANLLAHSNDNIVVSAPTGAGKTCLFEMAMAKLFSVVLHEHGRNHNGIAQQLPKHRKVVYIAPSKALCDERFADWSRRLADMHLGIQCAMITGDAEPGDCYRDMATAHVILTTPEKWDSVTRRWTENFFLIASVKLLMIDEVHLLGDSSRGCCLESVVCRMKTIFRATQNIQPTEAQIHSSSYPNTTPEAISSFLRIVAVSATLPNVSDIADFLGANETFAFDASYRPVPLTVHTMGFHGSGTNQFMFNKNLNNRIPDLIHRFSKGKPTIIFCHTKKECELLASELSVAQGIGRQGDQGSIAAASQTRIKSLQKVLYRGVGYHHAGLEAGDRKIVENAFGDSVRILCATSTLAMGVNLPAHLVIIKGTLAWRGAGEGYSEINHGTMLQMMGRAGRPGFDTEGTAVIMTDESSKKKYERLSGGLETVESQMPVKLIECLNSEISQHVITSFTDAMNWIKGTLFFVRASRNPDKYGLKGEDRSFELAFTSIVGESLRELDEHGLISVRKNDGAIFPLAGSIVMSSHLVDYAAMKEIVGLPFDTTQAQLLMTIAGFDRLHRPVRRSEKKVLNQLHKTIRYKLDGPASKVRVQCPWEKAFVLLQAAVGKQGLDDYTLRQEMSMMVDFAARMLVAIEEFSASGSMHGHVALQCLRLRRSFSCSLWGTGDGVLNQLTGVGTDVTAKLRFNQIITFADALAATDDSIEQAAGKPPPFGKGLRRAVGTILKNTLQLSVSIDANERRMICNLSKRCTPDIFHSNDVAGDGDVVKYSLVAYTDRPGGTLQYLSRVFADREYQCELPKVYGKLFISLIANLVGLDEKVVIDGNDDLHLSRFTITPTKELVKPEPKSHNASVTRRKQQRLYDAIPRNNEVRMMKRSTSSVVPQEKAAGQNIKEKTAPLSSSRLEKRSPSQCEAKNSTSVVTPSPRPIHLATSSIHNKRNARESGYHRTPLACLESKMVKIPYQSTWNQEKRAQRCFQQSAFVNEKENPFSCFKFDPNDVESNLEALTSTNMQQQQADIIIPPSVISQLSLQRRMNGVTESSVPFRMRNAHRASRLSYSRGKRYRPVRTISHGELLRMKAEEQHRLRYTPASTGVSVASQAGNYSPFTSHQQMHIPTTPYPQASTFSLSPPSWNGDEHPTFQDDRALQSAITYIPTTPDAWPTFENELRTSSLFSGVQVPMQPSACTLFSPRVNHCFANPGCTQQPFSRGVSSPFNYQRSPFLESGIEGRSGFVGTTDTIAFGNPQLLEDDDTFLDLAFF